MSHQQTLEQERASSAWKFIQGLPESVRKDYASLAKKAPADIQTNGLGQTVAFWRAKGFENGYPKNNGENAHYQILHHLTTWLKNSKALKLQTENLVEWISSTEEVNTYRLATIESIAFLAWIKRFAESELPS